MPPLPSTPRRPAPSFSPTSKFSGTNRPGSSKSGPRSHNRLWRGGDPAPACSSWRPTPLICLVARHRARRALVTAPTAPRRRSGPHTHIGAAPAPAVHPVISVTAPLPDCGKGRGATSGHQHHLICAMSTRKRRNWIHSGQSHVGRRSILMVRQRVNTFRGKVLTSILDDGFAG